MKNEGERRKRSPKTPLLSYEHQPLVSGHFVPFLPMSALLSRLAAPWRALRGMSGETWFEDGLRAATRMGFAVGVGVGAATPVLPGMHRSELFSSAAIGGAYTSVLLGLGGIATGRSHWLIMSLLTHPRIALSMPWITLPALCCGAVGSGVGILATRDSGDIDKTEATSTVGVES